MSSYFITEYFQISWYLIIQFAMCLNTSVIGTELIEPQGECFCILLSLFLLIILISGTFLVLINYINKWILQNIWDVLFCI